jgi:hypothetical protein
LDLRHHTVLAPLSGSYSVPEGRFPRVTHPCATRSEDLVRLACVRHAASVRSEPESNSQVFEQSPKPGGITEPMRTALQGAVPAQYMVYWDIGPKPGKSRQEPKWNGIMLNPSYRRLEAVGPGRRRPHVPSSKPTMRKNKPPNRQQPLLPVSRSGKFSPMSGEPRSAEAEAPLTRRYLCPPPTTVNSHFAILLRSTKNQTKTQG